MLVESYVLVHVAYPDCAFDLFNVSALAVLVCTSVVDCQFAVLQGQRLRDQALISGRDVGFSDHHIQTGC